MKVINVVCYLVILQYLKNVISIRILNKNKNYDISVNEEFKNIADGKNKF